MATLTTHLVKVFYVIANNCNWGFRRDEEPIFDAFLSSSEEKLSFSSPKGDFTLMRTTGEGKYGFRLYSPSRDFAGTGEILVNANREFMALDTDNPEATYHRKPFWAN